ncbi:MAG: MFS transporter [Bryobacterales bacterium]|nr:MFS transporter [Bryobacterales bacterium]
MGNRFWWLIAATFLGFLGMGTVLPGMAPHIRHDLGGTDETVGLVIGTFSFVALGSRFISGPLADRKGRKAAFLTGLFSCALAGGAYLLPVGIQGAYLGRTLQGFGEACLYTGAAAWVVEAAGIARSARALGFLSSGIWGGIAAGPVVGSWLVSFEHAAMMQVVAALAGFLILSRIPEDYTPHPDPGKRVWLPGHLIKPGLAVGFVSVHYPVVAGFLILHLANHGNSGPMAFSAYAGFMLLARFFFGGLPDRVPPRRTFHVGIVAMAIGLAGLAMGPPPVLAIASSAMLGLGFSFPWSSILSTVLKRTPSHERGSVVGVMSAFYDLFVGVSSFAAGAIANHFGYNAVFLMALFALGAAVPAARAVFASEHFEPVLVEAGEDVPG